MPRYPPVSEGFQEFVSESCFLNIFVQKLDKFQMTRLGIRTEASLVNDIRSLPAVWASCVTTSEFSRLRKAKRPTILLSIGSEKLKDQNVAINGFRKRSKCREWDISWINRFSFGLWADDNQGMDIGVGRRWSRKSCLTRKKTSVYYGSPEISWGKSCVQYL